MNTMITTSLDTTFAALRTSYRTWEALSTYLKTDLGLMIRKASHPYVVIHYDKTKSRMSNSLVRTFRSVVWDTEAHMPVSITPPKSVDGERLPVLAEPADAESYVVSEFYDGTLIGAFRCKYTNKIILHTRTHLPATNTYYSSKSFADMVEEAYPVARLEDVIQAGECASFILQHPENRIVVRIAQPKLRILQTAKISEDGTVGTVLTNTTPLSDPAMGIPNPSEVFRLRGPAEFGKILLSKFAQAGLAAPFQGVVLVDVHSNTRYKLRTASYNAIRQLRGNTPKLDYVWLTHWKLDKLADYLRIYPEEKTRAYAVMDEWKRCSNEMFGFYKDVFIFHTLQLNQVPRKYRPLLHELHELYKTELKPQGRRVTWHEVRTFMNKQDIPRILFVLHWKEPTVMTAPSQAFPPLAPSAAAVAAAVHVDVTERPTGGFTIHAQDYPTPTPITEYPSPTPTPTYAAMARRSTMGDDANALRAIETHHNDFD